jgi:hypothetical protein
LAHSLEKSLAPLRVDAASGPLDGKAPKPRGAGKSGKSAKTPTDQATTPQSYSPEIALAELSAWMEPRHTLLLRTLIDRTETVHAAGAPAVAQGVSRVIEGLRKDARLKYSEFRERWEARLEPRALLPFLTRNQWIVPHDEGGVVLTGKGMRKEARMLYLQTGHDMATDCARQWASLAGRLQAFQTSFAAEWHAAVVMPEDDATRLLPTLEATLRDAEFEAWKKMRLSLGEIAEEAFIKAVLKWETRPFADEEALVRGLLHPWVRLSATRNGWAGYMRVLSFLGERMALAMLDHYQRKWELYLRGLPRAEADQTEINQGLTKESAHG